MRVWAWVGVDMALFLESVVACLMSLSTALNAFWTGMALDTPPLYALVFWIKVWVSVLIFLRSACTVEKSRGRTVAVAAATKRMTLVRATILAV